ncbi:DUF6941 family protein [Paracidobacterium acidisoli]|uniref:Uncharacterized protein n=1 Tax=Paracidobacterium acidisoli TaxID=2303751 RepID=A0A372IQ14_9BACT|nr:hypothetical protein [Paracidobacterium acidisoli]MBT9331305.1 hypothetical protein [Paracidobacterium acidisoli]
MPETTETFRPFVQIAAFCQLALNEANGALSVVRVMDRIGIQGIAPTMQPVPVQNLTLVIVLKSGFMRGSSTVKIIPRTPSGEDLPGNELSALFEGEDRGVGIVMPIGLIAKEEGLYWFDIQVDSVSVTQIPLRIVYQRISQGMSFQSLR